MRLLEIAVVLAAMMVLALACAKKEVQEPMTSAPFYTSLDEAETAMGDRDLPIILDFYTGW